MRTEDRRKQHRPRCVSTWRRNKANHLRHTPGMIGENSCGAGAASVANGWPAHGGAVIADSGGRFLLRGAPRQAMLAFRGGLVDQNVHIKSQNGDVPVPTSASLQTHHSIIVPCAHSSQSAAIRTILPCAGRELTFGGIALKVGALSRSSPPSMRSPPDRRESGGGTQEALAIVFRFDSHGSTMSAAETSPSGKQNDALADCRMSEERGEAIAGAPTQSCLLWQVRQSHAHGAKQRPTEERPSEAILQSRYVTAVVRSVRLALV